MGEKTTLRHFLEHVAYNLRRNSLIMTSKAGSGHPTSCLSGADIVAALFFYAMRFDPHSFNAPNNDRFILSKGHAAPLLYAAWQQIGVISEQELMTYRSINSVLEGHPTLRFPYAEAATGSLGIGLSIGAGMALTAKLDQRDYRTYVLLGDGEIAEGSVWEALEIASFYHLNNLIGILDCNRLGQSSATLHAHHVDRYAHKFEAFGWKCFIVDGHDMQHLMEVLDKARNVEEAPVMIIAKTFKGHGVELFENKEGYHGKVLNKDELAIALEQLDNRYRAVVEHNQDYVWKPAYEQQQSAAAQPCQAVAMHEPTYKVGDRVATRKAYGQAVTALGVVCKSVVCLDADVKNSTFAEIFEAKFPERFFQCFIAEQNMVGMGIGFNRRGKIPFISTFAAFFSRAHDQIRMAAIGTSALRLVGSHAGVSIGQDGPSQMGLEDMSLMAALPGSCVLYPCDAVATYRLVGLMASYTGISYLRTTRMETPVIYSWQEEFSIGGCKVLKSSDSDKVCIVAAGITVFEALKAYEQLQAQGIAVAVIDAYSIKPLDTETIMKVAYKAGNHIVTVEDHYLEGGLGQTVAYNLRNSALDIDCLAVTKLPRSGKPEELLAWAGIDAKGISREILKIVA